MDFLLEIVREKAEIAESWDNRGKDASRATEMEEEMQKKPEGGGGEERAEVGH